MVLHTSGTITDHPRVTFITL